MRLYDILYELPGNLALSADDEPWLVENLRGEALDDENDYEVDYSMGYVVIWRLDGRGRRGGEAAYIEVTDPSVLIEWTARIEAISDEEAERRLQAWGVL